MRSVAERSAHHVLLCAGHNQQRKCLPTQKDFGYFYGLPLVASHRVRLCRDALPHAARVCLCGDAGTATRRASPDRSSPSPSCIRLWCSWRTSACATHHACAPRASLTRVCCGGVRQRHHRAACGSDDAHAPLHAARHRHIGERCGHCTCAECDACAEAGPAVFPVRRRLVQHCDAASLWRAHVTVACVFVRVPGILRTRRPTSRCLRTCPSRTFRAAARTATPWSRWTPVLVRWSSVLHCARVVL